jgi:hypothetical protein
MASSRRFVSTTDDDYSDTIREWLEEDENISDLDDSDADPNFVLSEHESESEIEESDSEDPPNLQVRTIHLQTVPISNEQPSTSTSTTDRQLPVSTRPSYWYGRGKEKFKWSKIPPHRRSRTPAHNIIPCVHLPGNIGPAKAIGNKCTEVQAWEFIITDDIINEIVVHTNENLEETRVKYKTADKIELRNTDFTEVRALIGMLFYSGIFKSNHEDLDSLYASDGTGRDIFRATISLKRILTLLMCLRFDNKADRQERVQDDKAAAISWVFNRVIENSQMNYCPFEHVCVDEMLVPFRGRCRFKVYMPKKPAKYGLKVMILADAKTKTHYFLNWYIYTGKKCDGQGLSVEENKLLVPTQSVIRLTKPIANSKRNVTADNWFTSVQLVRELSNKELTYVGTMKKNKAEIPKEFLPNSQRQVETSEFGFTNDMTLVSFVPKKGKSVVLVSSMHHDAKIYDDTKKPEIIIFYNSTKGGVDALDQKCALYSVSRRSKRWPTVLFYAILNISSVNSQVIHYCFRDNDKQPRLTFIKNLSRALVEPHLKRRLYNERLPRELRKVIGKILQEDVPKHAPAFEGKRKRCELCPRERDRKTKFVCKACNKAYCLECRAGLCADCENDV